jgi:hypothetical protein
MTSNWPAGAKRCCRILQVAQWDCPLVRDHSQQPFRPARLAGDVIAEIHDESRRTYGWRQIRAETLIAMSSW